MRCSKAGRFGGTRHLPTCLFLAFFRTLLPFVRDAFGAGSPAKDSDPMFFETRPFGAPAFQSSGGAFLGVQSVRLLAHQLGPPQHGTLLSLFSFQNRLCILHLASVAAESTATSTHSAVFQKHHLADDSCVDGRCAHGCPTEAVDVPCPPTSTIPPIIYRRCRGHPGIHFFMLAQKAN